MKQKKKKADKHPTNSLPEKKHDASHLAQYKWQKGQSGNPNGRPPDPLLLVNKHKELADMPAPKNLVDELRRQGAIPEAWEKDEKGRPREITWGEAGAIRNWFKGTSPRGDFIMKVMWEMLEGKPTIRIEEDGPPRTQRHYDLRKLTVEDLRELRDAELRRRAIIEKAAIEDADLIKEK